MSNTAYPAKVRRVNTAGGSSAPAQITPDAVDIEEEDYLEDDEYVDLEEAPAGLLGSRGRTAALGGAVVLLLVVFGAAFWLLGSRTSTAPTGPRVVGLNVGNIAPDFQLVDVHTNKPVQLAGLRGKPVLVNFWGTWCPPCRAEMPEMQKVYNQYKDQIAMVGVSMGPRDEPTGVKTFVDNAKYNWTFIHDADYNVATRYIVNSVPSSYFIDKDGIIRARYVGAMNSSQMTAFIAKTQNP
ncbi:MAG TPA: TlpA disulfide reductase family protein [Chloroflexia bacterium]|nr:TlpA disulfide reductase family protein [Chloroflexia bacterium]